MESRKEDYPIDHLVECGIFGEVAYMDGLMDGWPYRRQKVLMFFKMLLQFWTPVSFCMDVR